MVPLKRFYSFREEEEEFLTRGRATEESPPTLPIEEMGEFGPEGQGAMEKGGHFAAGEPAA